MENTTEITNVMEKLREQSLSEIEILGKSQFVSEDIRNMALLLLSNPEFARKKKAKERAERELAEILSAPQHPDLLLTTKFGKRENLQYARTARFMGAYPKVHSLVQTVPQKEKLTEEQMISKEDQYYKEWLGRKFGLSGAEVSEKSLSDIEDMARGDLRKAIGIIEKYVAYADGGNHSAASPFRSEYFDHLHNIEENWTVRDYFGEYMAYEMQIQEYEKENNYPFAIRQFRMAQWEIRRILTLAMRFRDNERTPDAILHKLDDGVLVDKLVSIIDIDPNAPAILPGSKNPLYEKTQTREIYWKRNADGDAYEITETPEDGFIPLQLESATLIGKKNSGLTEAFRKKYKVHHIQVRKLKNDESRLEKSIRKPEFQMLDLAGIVIVLDDFSKVEQLAEMITNELGTMNTSFREKLEDVGNSQTSSAYRCKKCVIKIPHAFKPIKQDLQQASAAIAETSKRFGGEVHKSTRRAARHHMSEVSKHMETFSKIAADLGRDLYVEIQFFDLPSYIAAEIDAESDAFHEKYKKRQRMLQIAPLLFPSEVYWKNTLAPLYKEILAEKYKIDAEDIGRV